MSGATFAFANQKCYLMVKGVQGDYRTLDSHSQRKLQPGHYYTFLLSTHPHTLAAVFLLNLFLDVLGYSQCPDGHSIVSIERWLKQPIGQDFNSPQ
jgi:hypothetical protein